MSETRRIWSRLEGSLGEIRRELEEMMRREREWKLEKERMTERLDKLERMVDSNKKEVIEKMEKRIDNLDSSGDSWRMR